jgi:hypothetical protein
VTAEQLHASLFKNRKRLAAAAGELLSPEEIDLLVAKQPEKAMTHSEFALLDEAHGLIDPDLRTFGHVVVDEAQNLSPMELRMVVRRARRQSLTVLGDIAQRTAEARLSTWDAVLGDAGVERLAIEELLVSYRVPDDFLRVAAPYSAGTAVPAGVRDAPWPPVSIATSDLPGTARALAQRLAGVGSVAVIASAGVMAAENHDDGLSSGVNVLGLDAIKGLEFDAAIVVEPARILEERPDGGRGGLYTALTRSTRALAVVHDRPLPEGLAGTLQPAGEDWCP